MTPHPIDLHIGRRIRNRRKLLGYTQPALARSVGVAFQQIQKYECGANRVLPANLWRLARAMDVEIAYFFEGFELPADRLGA